MKKPIYVLVGVLVIFLIVYFLLVQKEKKTFSPGKTENFLGLDSAAVDRIELRKFDTKLAFQKENLRWYMVAPDSHRADGDALGRLLSLASRLEAGEIISSNPEKQFWFQIDSLTGTGLNFLHGEDLLASMVLGKTSEDLMNGYLRKAGSADVYLTDAVFVRMAQRSVNQWRDRKIFTFDPEQIEKIELKYEGDRIRLVREDSLWQLGRYPYQETSGADAEAVESYARTLANMRADDLPFKTQFQGIEFERGEPLLKISLEDGREIKLFAVPSPAEEDKYFVKTDEDKSVFTLFDYNFKQLIKKPQDFQPKEEP